MTTYVLRNILDDSVRRGEIASLAGLPETGVCAAGGPLLCGPTNAHYLTHCASQPLDNAFVLLCHFMGNMRH